MFYGQLQKRVRALDKSSLNDFLAQSLQIGQKFHIEHNVQEACVWLLRAGESMNVGKGDYTKEVDPTLPLILLQSLLALPPNGIGEQGEILIKQLFSLLDATQASSMPYRLTVLEYYTKENDFSSPDAQMSYDFSLKQFTRLTALSQSTFDTIVYYVNQQFSVSPQKAFSVLQGVLMPRLIGEQNREWVEKTIIIMVYFQGKMQESSTTGVQCDLEITLSKCQRIFGDFISAQGVHACLMVWDLLLLVTNTDSMSGSIDGYSKSGEEQRSTRSA